MSGKKSNYIQQKLYMFIYIHIRSSNNGRTSDNVRPKSKFVRPNEKDTRHSARREKPEAKLNIRPDYASV